MMPEFLDLLCACAWLKNVKATAACVLAQGYRWRIKIAPEGTASIKMLEIDPLHPEWMPTSEWRK
jgi:hypothetical protein